MSGGAGSRLMDRVSCSICMFQFDSKIHVPKILPCQHTFCLVCLSSMSNHQMTIVCPVCREKIDVPTKLGYTTNRAVLDIVDELKKDPSSDAPKSSDDVPKRPTDVLKCPRHNNAESVLMCINCLEGLCLKCIKQGAHHNHKLEELADAKSLLRPKFDEQIRNELSIIDAMMSLIEQSAYSVAETIQAEEDLKTISDQMTTIFNSWRSTQQAALEDCKQQAISRENEIQLQKGKLQSVLEHNDINIRELITKLKEPHSEQQTQNFNAMDFREAQAYNFGHQSQTFLENLHAVPCSKGSIASKFLKQTFNMNIKVVPPEKRSISTDVAVDTSDFLGTFFNQTLDVKSKEEHQLDTASRGIDVPTDTSKMTETIQQDAKHSGNVCQAAATNPSFPKSGGSIKSKIPAGTEVEDKPLTNAKTAAPNANTVNQSSYETANATLVDRAKANEATGVKTSGTSTPCAKTTASATTGLKTPPTTTSGAKTTPTTTAGIKTTTTTSKVSATPVTTTGVKTTATTTAGVKTTTTTAGVKTTTTTTGVKTTTTTAGVKTATTTTSGMKTTVTSTAGVKTTATTTARVKTTPTTTAGVKTATTTTAGVKTTATTTAGVNTTATVTAVVKTTTKYSLYTGAAGASKEYKPRKHGDIKIAKVVDNGTLIVQIEGKIIIYSFKTRICTLCADKSLQREEALHFLQRCKDVQLLPEYKKHVDAVKGYYLSLI